MLEFAFISRHEPTPEQVALATRANIKLVPVGDRDGFTFNPAEFTAAGFFGAAVVHGGAVANMMAARLPVVLFENSARPAEGGRPTFHACALHAWLPTLTEAGPGWRHDVIR